MQRIKQSDPRAAFRRVEFLCVDTAALQTRLQASDMSSFVVYLTKNGGTPALATASAPVEIGATNMKGSFYVELAQADCDTAGILGIRITNTGGTKTMEPREIVVIIDQAYFAVAATGTLTSTAFTTNLTQTTDDFWKDCLVIALSGTLIGQVKRIGAYTGSSKLITLTSGFTFTASPSNGDVFELIDR